VCVCVDRLPNATYSSHAVLAVSHQKVSSFMPKDSLSVVREDLCKSANDEC